MVPESKSKLNEFVLQIKIMDEKEIGKFVTKIAEAEVIFQGLTNYGKEEAYKVILSFFRRCEQILSSKIQSSDFTDYKTKIVSESDQYIIDQFYTPELIIQSLLYDIVEKAVTQSEEKTSPNHHPRERKPSIRIQHNSDIDYGSDDDTDEYDAEISSVSRKRKQTNPRRALGSGLIRKNKKRRLTGPKVKRKDNSKQDEYSSDVTKHMRTRSSVVNKNVSELIQTRSSTYHSHSTPEPVQTRQRLVLHITKQKNRGQPSVRQVYSCEKCVETFTHKQSLYTHCVTEHDDSPRSCKQCKREFYSDDSFNKHKCKQVRREINEGPHVCKICGQVLQTKKLLNVHMKQSHPKPPKEDQNKDGRQVTHHICKFCDRGFVKKISLYKHYLEHSNGKLVCQKCGEFSDNAEEHDKHMLEHNKGAQFFCTKCGVHFHGSRQYEQHLDAHTRHDCLVCGKRLPTHKLLVKHCKNVHDQHVKPEERIWYSCDHCDKKFSRPNLLEVHMRIHTGEKPVECSICKIFFRTTKALAKHRQTYTHTIKAGEKPTDRKFLCSECGKAYFRKHALQRHMRYHTGDKPHMCQYCGYKCREVNNLKRHMSLHFEGERNFVCEVCGAAFHAKKTLEMHHAYKHSEERNFACSECMLTFKAKNALKRHMKVHTCEKDHKCWCGTAFKRMYNLRRHLKAVHGTDDLLPPVRRVQTLDKVTKKPVPKPEKVQQPNLQSQNLKREIENLITETSNLSRSEEEKGSISNETLTYVTQPEEQPQPLHLEPSSQIHLPVQVTPVPVTSPHQQMLQRPPTPPQSRQAPSDLRQHSTDLRLPIGDIRQHTTDHVYAEDINNHRMRYTPSEPPAMMYTTLPLMDRQPAHTQSNTHPMEQTGDPYMQIGSSSSFIPQAVAYSTILREYGSQFPFIPDSGGSTGGTYPSFVK